MTVLIEFPCQFPIKAMGTNAPDLIPEITAIIAANCNTFNPEADIACKESVKGNYISVTATITATSQQQLDNIYSALNKHELIKFTL